VKTLVTASPNVLSGSATAYSITGEIKITKLQNYSGATRGGQPLLY